MSKMDAPAKPAPLQNHRQACHGNACWRCACMLVSTSVGSPESCWSAGNIEVVAHSTLLPLPGSSWRSMPANVSAMSKVSAPMLPFLSAGTPYELQLQQRAGREGKAFSELQALTLFCCADSVLAQLERAALQPVKAEPGHLTPPAPAVPCQSYPCLEPIESLRVTVPSKAGRASQQQSSSFTSLTGDTVVITRKAPGHPPNLQDGSQLRSSSLPGSQPLREPARPGPQDGSCQPLPQHLPSGAAQHSMTAQPAPYMAPAASASAQQGQGGLAPTLSNAQAASAGNQPCRPAGGADVESVLQLPGSLIPHPAPVPTYSTQGTGIPALHHGYLGIEGHTAPGVPVPASRRRGGADPAQPPKVRPSLLRPHGCCAPRSITASGMQPALLGYAGHSSASNPQLSLQISRMCPCRFIHT